MNTMVALLTSDPVHPSTDASAPRLGHNRSEGPVARRSRLRHLHAVPELKAVPELLQVPSPEHAPGSVSPGADAGERDLPVARPRRVVSTTEISAAVAVVVLAMVFVSSFGSVQAPPAATWEEVNGPAVSVAPLDVGETLIKVKPGDTLWGLAGVIAPSADRREVVQILAERNGGSSIWAGQDLIVPASVANL